MLYDAMLSNNHWKIFFLSCNVADAQRLGISVLVGAGWMICLCITRALILLFPLPLSFTYKTVFTPAMGLLAFVLPSAGAGKGK